MAGAKCYQTFARGEKPPKVLASAVEGHEWANPRAISDDGQYVTYEYTLRRVR